MQKIVHGTKRSVKGCCYSLVPKSTNGVIGTLGDWSKLICPAIAFVVALGQGRLKKVFVCFMFSLVVMWTIKFISIKFHCEYGKRPVSGRHHRYSGMPSSHVTYSATAAALMSNSYDRLLVKTLYLIAAFTGLSRLYSRKHTITQVASSFVLSETIVRAARLFGFV